MLQIFPLYLLTKDVAGINTTFIQMYNSIVNNFELSLTKSEQNVKRQCLYVLPVVEINVICVHN